MGVGGAYLSKADPRGPVDARRHVTERRRVTQQYTGSLVRWLILLLGLEIPAEGRAWPGDIRGRERLAARLAAQMDRALLYRKLAT